MGVTDAENVSKKCHLSVFITNTLPAISPVQRGHATNVISVARYETVT